MTEQRVHTPHRVLIGGGGIAALEALIALHHLARDQVTVTLIAPSDEFVVRAMSVEQPFGKRGSLAYDVEQACGDHGAKFVRDAIHRVHADRQTVITRSGAMVPYDSLLLGLGARPAPAYEGVTTFRGPYDAEAMHALLRRVDQGEVHRVAFVVPPGTTWPLPLYELALMTAERAEERGLPGVELTVVTPEPQPLAVFGRTAGDEVAALLGQRGIAVHTSCHCRRIDCGTVFASPGDVVVEADHVVALPVLNGPRVAGLPADDHGFLPVDEHGAVPGLEGVFGAGDGTTIAIKQGGVAAQQADAAARAIAFRAGADVEPRGFKPHLRARLMTGKTSTWLRQEPAGGAGDQASAATEHALWWPPTKVAAPYLAPYLDRLESGEPGPVPDAVVHALHAQGDPAGGVEVLGS